MQRRSFISLLLALAGCRRWEALPPLRQAGEGGSGVAFAADAVRTAIAEVIEDSGPFSYGAFAGMPREALLAKLRQTGTGEHWFDVQIAPETTSRSSSVPFGNSSYLMGLDVVVTVWTGLATPAQLTQRDAILDEIGCDCGDAARSLARPGALLETAAGQPTGIVGGCMSQPPRWRMSRAVWGDSAFVTHELRGRVDVRSLRLDSWFVDSVNGDDDNDGRTAASAFATLAALDGADVLGTDTVYLVTDSVFREELIDLPEGITVRSHGTGEKPWIKGSDIAPNASFTAVGGATPNVYSIPWTHEFGGSAENLAHRVWEDGTMLRRVNALATCNSTPGSFYAPAITTGADTIYVHATDSSAVTSNGKVYELTRRMWCVRLREFRAHATVMDLQAIGNAHAAGAFAIDGNMYRCIAWDGRIHNVYLRGYAEDCDAINMEPPDSFGASTMWVTHDSQGSDTHEDGRSTIYRRCRALADGDSLAPNGGQNDFYTLGFYAHMSIGGTLGTVFWDECHAEYCVNGFASSSSVQVAVMHKCTTGEDVNIAQNLLAPTVIVLGGTLQCEGVNSGATIYSTDFTNPDVFKMRGVRVLKASGGGVGPILQRTASSVNDVSRCTIYIASGGSVQSLYNGTWQFNENVVYGAGLTHRVGFPGEATPSYTADRNVYYNPSGAFAWRRSDVGGNTDYSTIAAWQAAMSTEASSVNSNPQFTGSPASGEWTFAPGSPPMLLGAGADYEGDDDATLHALRAQYTDGLVTT